MNWEKLFSGITNRQFEELAENWYLRTKTLQVTFEQCVDLDRKKERLRKLYLEMLSRMVVITKIYTAYRINQTPVPNKTFDPGGVIPKGPQWPST